MAEGRIEPTLGLTVEGKRYHDSLETFIGTKTQGTVHIDPESERELVEKLRAVLAKRLEFLTGILAVKVDDLDFTSPALPSRTELEGIVAVLDKAHDTASALREMSPEVWDDDEEDEDEPEPTPDPEEPAHAA